MNMPQSSHPKFYLRPLYRRGNCLGLQASRCPGISSYDGMPVVGFSSLAAALSKVAVLENNRGERERRNFRTTKWLMKRWMFSDLYASFQVKVSNANSIRVLVATKVLPTYSWITLERVGGKFKTVVEITAVEDTFDPIVLKESNQFILWSNPARFIQRFRESAYKSHENGSFISPRTITAGGKVAFLPLVLLPEILPCCRESTILKPAKPYISRSILFWHASETVNLGPSPHSDTKPPYIVPFPIALLTIILEIFIYIQHIASPL